MGSGRQRGYTGSKVVGDLVLDCGLVNGVVDVDGVWPNSGSCWRYRAWKVEDDG
jgi:hypothetical protein